MGSSAQQQRCARRRPRRPQSGDDGQGAHSVHHHVVEKGVGAGQLQEGAEVTEEMGDLVVGAE